MPVVDLKRYRVLIVDDFGNMRGTLKRMVQSLGGNDIDLAINGREALDRLRRQHYDIVLCDYNLGEGKDGQQVLEEAKFRKFIRPSTIFVMITAENTHDMVMGAMEYRPDDYLTKPFNKDLLGNRLKRLLERKANLGEVENAIEKGEFARAIGMCDHMLAKNPRNASELRALKVDLCLTVGQFDEAQRVCEEVLAQRPLPWALMAQGKIHFHRKDYLSARDVFTRITDQHKAYMEAYDWLAKTYEALEKPREAQDVLMVAARLSPKAILRQQALGELAARNRDFETAERSFRKTVGLGKYSVYRRPNHYTGLANALVHRDSGQEALKVLGNLRKEFSGEPEADFEAALSEGSVLKVMGRDEEARQSYDEALKLHETVAEQLDTRQTMELARACFNFGDKERGVSLVQEVVRNHHEESDVLAEAQRAFDDAGLGEEGAQAIADAKNEVLRLNNEGVNLAKQGRMDEASKLFEEAAAKMPSNRTVNLNAAQVLLARMQKQGKDDRSLYQVRQYLERVGSVDRTNATYQKLLGVYEKLLQS